MTGALGLLQVARPARERGRRRVRRAGAVGRRERQHLPPRLARVGEPVDERGSARGRAVPPGRDDTCSSTPLERRNPQTVWIARHVESYRTLCRCPRPPPRIQIEDVWPPSTAAGTRSSARSASVVEVVGDDRPRRPRAARRRRALPPAGHRRVAGGADAHGRQRPLDGVVRRRPRWAAGSSRSRPGSTATRRGANEIRRKVEAGQADLDERARGGRGADRGARARRRRRRSRRPRPTAPSRPGSSAPLEVDVDRERARFGAWYELFPRSWGGFAGVEQLLPELAELGFDVVYLPPIHPIGVTNRKGRNNALDARARRARQPVGDRRRGRRAHGASTPSLGTIDGVRPPGRRRRASTGIEIALDFAIQCSPDHPWLTRAPRVVPPPARRHAQVRREPAQAVPGHLQRQLRQPDWQGLWAALRDVVLFWVEHGVQRVPRRQPAHEAAAVLGVADRRGARGRPRRGLPRRGVHAAGDDGGARQGRLQPVVHVLHLEEHEGGADRVRHRADRARSCRSTSGRTSSRTRRTSSTRTSSTAAGRRSRRGWCSPRRCRRATGSTRGSSTARTSPVRAGSEEYLDSEKYEVEAAGARRAAAAARRAAERDPARNPALQRLDGVDFLDTENEQLIAYAQPRRGATPLIVCVNLDPRAPHEGVVVVPAQLGLPPAVRRRATCSPGTAFRWRIGPQLRAPRAGPRRTSCAWSRETTPMSRAAGQLVRARPAVVQARGLLRDPHPRLLRRQRRRHRRLPRADREARLPPVARDRLHLAAADVRLAAARRRLRHRRLQRDPPRLRHRRGLPGVRRGRARARHARDRRPGR